MAKRKQKRLSLGERDLRILKSIWRWRFSTTAAVGEEFFGNPFSDPAYIRLRALAREDYVRLEHLPFDRGAVWSLGKRGFERIRGLLPELKEVRGRPHKFPHDYFVTVLQRGPCISGLPDGMELVTEQEILCMDSARLSSWLPSSDHHRADGYTLANVSGEPAVIALEVELNCKHELDYHRVAAFYARARTIYRVVWVTESDDNARWIQSIFREATPKDFLVHDFLVLSDLEKSCWEAKILLGHEAEKPLSHILASGITHSPLTGVTPSILDRRKRPYSSCIYGSATNPRNSNSMALSATPNSPTFNVPPTDQRLFPSPETKGLGGRTE